MLAALSAGAETALIVAAASLATAVVTAAAATYASRVHIREVRLTYDQKLHGNYLANARAYTNSVYVPLSVALTHLSASFLTFRDGLIANTREAAPEAVDLFKKGIGDFVSAIDEFTTRGADAFLTRELEDELVSLTTFLRKSTVSTAPRASVVFTYGVGFGGLSASASRETSGKVARAAYGVSEVSLNLFGVRASSRVGKLLEAPLTSPAFERRMVEDLASIKMLIKEVTLGAHAGPL